MAHWNHRVVKETYRKGMEDEEDQYSIREIFYNDDGSIMGYTDQPIDLACETPEALREYILWCLKALDEPFLIHGEVEFKNTDEDDWHKNTKTFYTIDEMFDDLNSGE